MSRTSRARRRGLVSLTTLALTSAMSVAGAAALGGAAHADTATPSTATPGTIFVADANTNRVLAVAPDGTRYTVASGLPYTPYGVAPDADGNVWVADGYSGLVRISPDGTQTTVPVPGLQFAYQVAVDPAGDVFVSDDYYNGVVYEVAPDGTSTTVATSGVGYVQGLAVDHQGNLYMSDTSNGRVVEVTPGGTQMILATDLSSPQGVAVDDDGNVWVADYGNNRFVRIAADGTETYLHSDDVPNPQWVAVDQAGSLYSTSGYYGSGNVYQVNADGTANSVALGGTSYSYGIGVSPNARLAQTTSFTSAAPSDATVGSAIDLTANAGGSGNPVSFTADQGSAGVCSVKSHNDDTATVTLTGAGTCTVTTAQAGNRGYLAADAAQQSFDVKANGALGFTSYPSSARVGGTYQATAAGSSASPVGFTSATPATCTVTAAGLVSFRHALPCSVVASQSADGSHHAAPDAVQTFRILRAKQAVHFTKVPKHSAKAGTSVKVKAAGSESGTKIRISVTGACSVNGKGKVSFLHAGTCHVKAVQSGNSDYQVGRTSHAVKVTHQHKH